MTKRFKEWFGMYGMMNDFPSSDQGDFNRIRRIAWRAYKRSRHDLKREQGRKIKR